MIEKNEEEEEKIVPDNMFVDFIEKAPKILDYEYLIEQEKNKKNLMNWRKSKILTIYSKK